MIIPRSDAIRGKKEESIPLSFVGKFLRGKKEERTTPNPNL